VLGDLKDFIKFCFGCFINLYGLINKNFCIKIEKIFYILEVKTVENGTELIEVIDNGNGILPEDFDKICIFLNFSIKKIISL